MWAFDGDAKSPTIATTSKIFVVLIINLAFPQIAPTILLACKIWQPRNVPSIRFVRGVSRPNLTRMPKRIVWVSLLNRILRKMEPIIDRFIIGSWPGVGIIRFKYVATMSATDRFAKIVDKNLGGPLTLWATFAEKVFRRHHPAFHVRAKRLVSVPSDSNCRLYLSGGQYQTGVVQAYSSAWNPMTNLFVNRHLHDENRLRNRFRVHTLLQTLDFRDLQWSARYQM